MPIRPPPSELQVALGGLALQAVCFAGFISLYVVFARRLRTFPQHQGKWNAVPWQRSGWPRFAHWRALYLAIGASCLCIAIRSIYRVAVRSSIACASRWPLFHFADGALTPPGVCRRPQELARQLGRVPLRL